ncbi:MAG TPA: mannose-6-phosphate isomerase, partial [Opitutaceae bacterium]|nr:mannose-6-phosphate isomerase [Opitutaceae bacterium]
EFRIRRVPLDDDACLEVGANEQPRLLSVVSGTLAAASGDALPTGSNVVLPYDTAFRFTAKGPTLILMTENFV